MLSQGGKHGVCKGIFANRGRWDSLGTVIVANSTRRARKILSDEEWIDKDEFVSFEEVLVVFKEINED